MGGERHVSEFQLALARNLGADHAERRQTALGEATEVWDEVVGGSHSEFAPGSVSLLEAAYRSGYRDFW